MLEYATAYRLSYSGLLSMRIHSLIPVMLQPSTSHYVCYYYFTIDEQKFQDTWITASTIRF